MKITKVIERLIESKWPRQEQPNPSHPYEGVTLVPKSGSCPKAHELSRMKRRFLAGEAPTLPLQECTTREDCGCHYASFTDRRLTERREKSFSSNRCFAGPERRRTHGRRSSDR
jgi:hypothetical protein